MGDDVERNQQKREMGRVALGLIALFFVHGAVATFSDFHEFQEKGRKEAGGRKREC